MSSSSHQQFSPTIYLPALLDAFLPLPLNTDTRYRDYYNASFPNTDYFPRAGAYHSSEILLVFGTYSLTNQHGVATEQQEQLSRHMQKTWAGFAKNPDQGPGWPRLGSNRGLELADLGGRNGVGETTIQLGEVDNVCAVYDVILDMQGY